MILFIFLFWISSGVVEGMKWSNCYATKIKLLDYHFFRLLQSSSFFGVCYYLISDIYLLLGCWIIANFIYERIINYYVTNGKLIRDKKDFKIFGITFIYLWWFDFVLLFIGILFLFFTFN
jgi:hypothetical protein